MTHRPRLAALAVLSVAALALAGCSSSGASPADDPSGGETSLTWGWALPTSWDPVTSVAGWDTHALALVYDGLTQLDPEGDVVPGLAESWEYDPTGTRVTFTLREDLTFADGTPIDAAAVKANLERGRDQADSTLAGQLGIITGVEVVDDRNVTVVLDQADYQVPYLFAGKTGFIVNPAAFDDVAALATQPEGSGPFELVEYVPNAHADLIRATPTGTPTTSSSTTSTSFRSPTRRPSSPECRRGSGMSPSCHPRRWTRLSPPDWMSNGSRR